MMMLLLKRGGRGGRDDDWGVLVVGGGKGIVVDCCREGMNILGGLVIVFFVCGVCEGDAKGLGGCVIAGIIKRGLPFGLGWGCGDCGRCQLGLVGWV